MLHTTRTRTAMLVTALALSLAACGGGGGSEEPAAPKPVTLEDLKPSEDHFSRELSVPTKLDLPEKWDLIGGSTADGLSGVLKKSFTDPKTWRATDDAAALNSLASGYVSVMEQNYARLGKNLLAYARKGALDGERVAVQWASVFPKDAQPKEAYIYKAKWDSTVKGDTVTVRAAVWAGYEVDGEPVLVARELLASGTENGDGTVSYAMNRLAFGGFYDFCSMVRDGVLAPDEDGISQKKAEILRQEFADQDYRPVAEVAKALAEADGKDLPTEAERTADKKECLAGA